MPSTSGFARWATSEMPKSVTVACPAASRRMSSGLMSRWTTPRAWAAASGCAISWASHATSVGINAPWRAIRSASDCPGNSRITSYSSPFFEPAAYTSGHSGGSQRSLAESSHDTRVICITWPNSSSCALAMRGSTFTCGIARAEGVRSQPLDGRVMLRDYGPSGPLNIG